MILITLGTQDKEFSRLLVKVEELLQKGIIKDKVVVQAGNTKFDSEKMEILDFVPMDKFDELISECDLLITHGGVGSIITGLRNGKKVIAVARLAKYNEHENDHQLQIISEFVKKNYILDGSNIDKLSDVLKEIKTKKFNKYKSESKMLDVISDYIDLI